MNYRKVIFITGLALPVIVVFLFVWGVFTGHEDELAVEEIPAVLVDEEVKDSLSGQTAETFLATPSLLFTIPEWVPEGEGYFELAPAGLDFIFRAKIAGVDTIFINGHSPLEDKGDDLRYRYDGTTAISVEDNGAWFVATGKNKYGPYQVKVVDFQFLPDGRLVFAAKRGNDWYLVVDGSEERVNGTLSGLDLVASPTGELAFKAYKIQSDDGPYGPNNEFYVVNGVAHGAYYDISDAQYSDDGAAIAYIATYYEFPQKGFRQAVVLDGVEGTWYEKVTGPVHLSPDGTQPTYIATKADRDVRVVFKGVEGKSYEAVDNLAVSPDGNHFAYTARRGDTQFVIKDRREIAKYPNSLVLSSLVLSGGESSRLAYRAEIIGNDKQPLAGAEATTSPKLSTPKTEKGHYVVVDGVWSEVSDEVSPALVFSSDGARLAYIVTSGNKIHTVVDGAKAGGYEKSTATEPQIIFSADSQHYAYALNKVVPSGQTSAGAEVILDGKVVKGEEYGHLYRVAFSPDGRYLSFVYQRGREFWYDVIPVQ